MTTNRIGRVVEVFADVCCPFTHVGLRRFVERRAAAGRNDVRLLVRAWPLEIVNGEPLDPAFIAEEVAEIRDQAAPTMFAGYTGVLPTSSLPAMAVAAAGYREGVDLGEDVSLRLRDLLFELGRDLGDPAVLAKLAAEHHLAVSPEDDQRVLADHAEGVARGVIGSPHFFTPSGGFFCPALDVGRDDRGHLRVHADPEGFERFLEACFT